ncbi:DedA family protein [Salinibacterium sp. PAMC 21357]|uniref:DedA family protein n=1 Tax=Salinibacterium sp. PAMC 21357 TaxID=1112215 RepID=UPI0006854958|nr:DedA family protein [Salinibacterium sp. PAMC 21357]
MSAQSSAASVDFGQWVNDSLSYVLDTVQSVDPVLRTLLAGIAIMLETSILVGLLVPGDTVVLVASSAVGSFFEAAILIAVVVVGALIGESVGFALGRYFGPKIRHSRLGKRIGEQHWVQAERYLGRRGGIAVFISRFLPVLHSLIPVTVGMSTMRYRTFMAWTVPATSIWSIAYVSVGALTAGSFRELLDQLHYAGYVFVAVIAVIAVIALIAKKLLHRSQLRHMEHREDE